MNVMTARMNKMILMRFSVLVFMIQADLFPCGAPIFDNVFVCVVCDCDTPDEVWIAILALLFRFDEH